MRSALIVHPFKPAYGNQQNCFSTMAYSLQRLLLSCGYTSVHLHDHTSAYCISDYADIWLSCFGMPADSQAMQPAICFEQLANHAGNVYYWINDQDYLYVPEFYMPKAIWDNEARRPKLIASYQGFDYDLLIAEAKLGELDIFNGEEQGDWLIAEAGPSSQDNLRMLWAPWALHKPKPIAERAYDICYVGNERSPERTNALLDCFRSNTLNSISASIELDLPMPFHTNLPKLSIADCHSLMQNSKACIVVGDPGYECHMPYTNRLLEGWAMGCVTFVHLSLATDATISLLSYYDLGSVIVQNSSDIERILNKGNAYLSELVALQTLAFTEYVTTHSCAHSTYH